MLFLIVLIHILICIVSIVLIVHTVIYRYFCTKIPVSASGPRCSIILVHVICLTLISTHVYIDNKIQFNSIMYIIAEFESSKVRISIGFTSSDCCNYTR